MKYAKRGRPAKKITKTYKPRQPKTDGMRLFVEMHFTNGNNTEQAFATWMAGITETSKASNASFIRLKGDGIPEMFAEALSAHK